MNDNEALAILAQGTLDRANEEYRRAKESGTVLSILLIALHAREIYGEDAKYVKLDYSDQGDFMSLYAVLDADRVDISDTDLAADDDDAEQRQERWDTFSDAAESSYAWNLDSGEIRHGWGRFLVDTETTPGLFPSDLLIDIDATITRIGGQL